MHSQGQGEAMVELNLERKRGIWMAAYRQGEGSVDLGNAAGPEMKKVVSA